MALPLSPFTASIYPIVLALVILITGGLPLPTSAQTVKDRLVQREESAKNAQLTQKSSSALNALKAQQYNTLLPLLSPSLAATLSPAKIEQLWNTVTSKVGNVQKMGNMRVINAYDIDVVVIETQFAKQRANFVVTYNKNGEIIGINVPGISSDIEVAEAMILALGERDYGKARLDLHPFLKTQIFASEIQEKWSEVTRRNGQFRKIQEIKLLPSIGTQGSNIVAARVEFEKGTQDLLVIFDENQFITGVNLVVE